MPPGRAECSGPDWTLLHPCILRRNARWVRLLAAACSICLGKLTRFTSSFAPQISPSTVSRTLGSKMEVPTYSSGTTMVQQAGLSRSCPRRTCHMLPPPKPSASTRATFFPSPSSSLLTRLNSGPLMFARSETVPAPDSFRRTHRSNKYFRSTPLELPLVTLSGYLRFWSLAFLLVTAYLAFFQPEVRLKLPPHDLAESRSRADCPRLPRTRSPRWITMRWILRRCTRLCGTSAASSVRS